MMICEMPWGFSIVYGLPMNDLQIDWRPSADRNVEKHCKT
jgi:hypothetical protein